VGANANNHNSPLSGSAYLFRYELEAWVEKEHFTDSDAAPYDDFATSLDIDLGWIIIGSPSDDDFGYSSGAAYAFAIPLFADDFESGGTSAWSAAQQ
jgi:hypothetical protein